MSRSIAVLRPEPGNRVTAAAIEARGRRAIRLPLFEVRALAWEAPDPAQFDALILTSANAIRHGGTQLARLLCLPVHAVGRATAEAATRAGFEVVATGDGGAAELMRAAAGAGVQSALHLGGRERTLDTGGVISRTLSVYASEPLAIDRDDAARLLDSVVLVQSARAARRLVQLIDLHGLTRADIALVALSAAVAADAGTGWQKLVIATEPSSETLIDAAVAVAD